MSLAWNASTDNKGVAQYWVHRCQTPCTSMTFVGPTTGLALTANNLTSGVNYLFTVTALDAAGNQSDPGQLQASPLDNVPPSAPGNLIATPRTSGTEIDLSWNAATDNVGVTGYVIERCSAGGCPNFTLLGTTSGATAFYVGSLTSATNYQFRVRARDAALLESANSNVASATTPDVIPPGVPSNLTAPSGTASSITLSWNAASDNVGIQNYDVIYCSGNGCTPNSLYTTTSSTSITASSLSSATWYSFQVRARDTSNITGGYSNVASRMTNDTSPPTMPGNFTATPVTTGTEVDLNWTASSDNIGVSGYAIERCNDAPCSSVTQIATDSAPPYQVGGLTPATTYRFRIRAYDAANNFSVAAGPVPVSTPDTIPPSTPGTLTATTISTSQVDLSWGPSTDNVGVASYSIQRCQGAGCTPVDYTTTSATTFNDTGLAHTTTYNYRVRARDAAFVWSGFTNTAGAQTFDGQAPTTPTGLAVSTVAGSGTALNLTWNASTDNVAVTGYAVERCTGASCSPVEIALPASNSFADSGLANGGTYSYRVRARDGHGNWSPNTAVVVGTANDTQRPTAPSGLAVSVGSATQLNLTWTASTDNVAVTLYSIERCQGASCSDFAAVGTSTTASFNSTGLAPATTYRFRVRARDAVDFGPYSSEAAQITPADGEAPTAPTGLTVGTTTVTQVNLSWTASTDNIAVTSYVIQRCVGSSCTPTDVATSTTTSYTDNSLTPATTYRYQVRARDAASNTSGASNVVAANTVADTAAPSTPTLVITGTTVTTATMTLSATDNVGVTGYELDRCVNTGCTSFTQIATPSSSPYTDTGLAPNTTYRYRARARDAAGQVSSTSSPVSATTPADNTPPSTPSNLHVSDKTAVTVSLAWDPATDNVGISSYRIQRCTGVGCSNWAEVGSTSGATTTFTSTGLTQLTTYRFRVGAQDGAGLTTYTSPISVVTNDGQAPTTPGGLTLLASPGQILLEWNASTDNVGVTAYLVERCITDNCTYTQIATVGASPYVDTTVASATDYQYRVAARDAQGNVSNWSTVQPVQSADCD